MIRLARDLTRLAPAILLAGTAWWATPAAAADACKAQKDDVVGCQPSPFDPPLAEMPAMRVGADGKINHKASEQEVRQGVKLLEKKLDLYRNFVDIHWVPLSPSTKDPKTGDWAGGDLDGMGDGRGITIAGNCIFSGHGNFANGGNDKHPLDILRIQDDPVKNAPVKVSEIAMPTDTDKGFDDTMMGAAMYKRSDGKNQIVFIRDMDNAVGKGDGRLYVYTVDPASCKVVESAEPYFFGGDFHEVSTWFDPHNDKRILIIGTSSSGAGVPDPERPGKQTPDIRIIAVTDENTGAMLHKPTVLATFRLEDVGGPVKDERPDATGLFSDGRYPDYSNLKDQAGMPLRTVKAEQHNIHQATMSADGERVYVAGAFSGFYILNTEAIAHAKNVDLLAGKAGCNMDSTNIYQGGVVGNPVDPAKLAQVANDCVHMVVNDDPGVKELIKAGKIGAYQALQDKSRWDPYPPVQISTGAHSAIPVPDRPSLDKNNDKGRPSLLVLTEEMVGRCPTSGLYVLQIEAEISPMIISTFGLPVTEVQNCIATPTKEPNGEMRKRFDWQAHDPTVFKNLIFVSWYGQGLRAIDISNPRNPREVGHANPLPLGQERSYPIYKDGLFYWNDTGNGLHVVRYVGPRADELPKPGTGMIYEGNSIPHL